MDYHECIYYIWEFVAAEVFLCFKCCKLNATELQLISKLLDAYRKSLSWWALFLTRGWLSWFRWAGTNCGVKTTKKKKKIGVTSNFGHVIFKEHTNFSPLTESCDLAFKPDQRLIKPNASDGGPIMHAAERLFASAVAARSHSICKWSRALGLDDFQKDALTATPSSQRRAIWIPVYSTTPLQPLHLRKMENYITKKLISLSSLGRTWSNYEYSGDALQQLFFKLWKMIYGLYFSIRHFLENSWDVILFCGITLLHIFE